MMLNFNNIFLIDFLFWRSNVVGALEFNSLELILELIQGMFPIFFAPEMKRDKFVVVSFGIVFMEEGAERL